MYPPLLAFREDGVRQDWGYFGPPCSEKGKIPQTLSVLGCVIGKCARRALPEAIKACAPS